MQSIKNNFFITNLKINRPGSTVSSNCWSKDDETEDILGKNDLFLKGFDEGWVEEEEVPPESNFLFNLACMLD